MCFQVGSCLLTYELSDIMLEMTTVSLLKYNPLSLQAKAMNQKHYLLLGKTVEFSTKSNSKGFRDGNSHVSYVTHLSKLSM